MIDFYKAEYHIGRCVEFKIGKTSLSTEERRKMPDYYDEYPYIVTLYESSNLVLVDYAEAELIDKYIGHPKNKNEKDGTRSEHDIMGESDTYRVYLVYK